MPLFLVGVTIVGIIAFALGGSLGKGPTPSPTVVDAAAASPTTGPSLAITPSLRPRYTMNLPTTPPTPTPAPTFPWTWARSEFGGELGSLFRGVWGVDDRVLLLRGIPNDFDDSFDWQVSSLDEVGAWQSFPAPTAIHELSGGTVIDGRLWFVAKVGGVTEDDASWQLVSVSRGLDWDSLGPAEGLGPVGFASFIGRVGGTWVTNVWGYEGSGSRLLWSGGGRNWHFATLPEFTGDLELWDAASLGNRMLILGREVRSPEDVETFVLTSTDGRTWARTSFGIPNGHWVLELACSSATCVAPVLPQEEDGTRRKVLVSTDGLDWSGVTIDLPMLDPGETIQTVRPTGRSFLAMAGNSGFALESPDGRDWTAVPVMPADRIEWMTDLAVAGDLVVGYAESQDSSPAMIWLGSLLQMQKV
jgi:hypothetical protein